MKSRSSLHFRVDMHADVLGKMLNSSSNYNFGCWNDFAHIDLPKLKQSKINVQFWAVFIETKFKPYFTLKKTLQQIELFHKTIEIYPEELKLLRSSSDLNRNDSRINLILSLEGGEALEDDLDILSLYYRLGVRAIGLTWNQRNQIADGVWDRGTGGGLTDFGKKLVQEMNRLGIIVDLAHISERGFYDVLSSVEQPVIVSHGNSKSICDHPRNLTDQQIRVLSENKGILGITFYPPFLTTKGTADIDDIVRHIAYVADLVGVDFVGIGSDFEGIEITPEGLEDISKLGELELSLAKVGFNQQEIKQILGENSVRVIEKVLK